MTATLIHSEWDYIARDLTHCEESLPRLTKACARKKTKKAAIEVCEMCRSTFGAFIDADHFIRDGVALDPIIQKFREAHGVVAETAGALKGSDRRDVVGYARNILLRIQILETYNSEGSEAARAKMNAL